MPFYEVDAPQINHSTRIADKLLMRSFNKLFVVSLPRCATVSMSQALGMLGVPTAHLGRICRQPAILSDVHYDVHQLLCMFEQISRNDFELSIFGECRALADYPACCLSLLKQFRAHYPGSLFINVRRDRSIQRWLQSIEQQFVGLDIMSRKQSASAEQMEFMHVMRKFRRLTFGDESFIADKYLAAYWNYQSQLDALRASDHPSEWLSFEDPTELEQDGFARLSEFLQVALPTTPFPRCDDHSRLPQAAFLSELRAGRVTSQTGVSG